MCKKALIKTGVILKRYWRSFAYYGCVLVVLCALAYAADAYRQENRMETVVLPAAEIISDDEREEESPLIMPTDVLILREYSLKPQWNDVLGQWENHEALDCSFDDGRVLSLCDGEIIGTGSDAEIGNYVEIENDDLIVRYGSLKETENLKPGNRISAGDAIGETGSSMLREQYMQEHAHIEFILEGKTVDPAAFF